MLETCVTSISGIAKLIDGVDTGSGVHTGTTAAIPLYTAATGFGVSVAVGGSCTVPVGVDVGVIVAVPVGVIVAVPVDVAGGVYVPVGVAVGVPVGVTVADDIIESHASMLKPVAMASLNENCNITYPPDGSVHVGNETACGDVFDVPVQYVLPPAKSNRLNCVNVATLGLSHDEVTPEKFTFPPVLLVNLI